MLVNEYFKISTSISNHFDVGLEKVFVSITIPDSLRNKGKCEPSHFNDFNDSVFFPAFLTTDLTSPIQNLSSQIQINIGDLQYQSTSTISYYLTSLVEGNIELKQRVWYETENLYRATTVNTPNNITLDSPTTSVVPTNSFATTKLLNNHNIQIIYLDEQMQKIREDTIVVPCVEAIRFSGRFYTLSRQALMRAYKNEDLLLRVNVEVKAACEIDILDITFISVSKRVAAIERDGLQRKALTQ
jgi:trafficking protein particle complex subunit 11